MSQRPIQSTNRRRWHAIRTAFLVVVMVFTPALISAPLAHAGSYDDLTGSPGQECRPVSLGNAAGSGFPGLVDPAPREINPADESQGAAEAAQKLQEGADKRIYHVYGWSGYNWEVCATGGPIKGGEAIGNTDAWGDSEIGSTMLKMGVGLAALNSGVAKMAASPGEIMAPLDDIVVKVSQTLRTSLVGALLPAILALSAALITINAMNKNVRKAVVSLGAILASLVGLAFLGSAPLKASQIMDGVASTVQTSILQDSQRMAGKEDVPAEETWGVIYTEDIIFPLWAQGITSWSQNDDRLSPNLDAERLGPTIEAKQKFESFTPTRAYQVRAYPWGAEKSTETDEDRRDAWNTIGEASQTDDAPTRAFAGQEENRAGTGFLALLAVISTASFSIPANLMIFFAEVAFRLLPIIGMVIVLFLAFEPTRPLATQIGRFFLSALVNGVILGVFAAAHLVIVSSLFSSDVGFLWSTIGSAIVSLIFFKVTKPVRSLTSTAVSLTKSVAGGVRRARNGGSSGAHTDRSATSGSTRRDTPQPNPATGNPGAGSSDQDSSQARTAPAPLKRQATIDPPRRTPTQRLIDTTNPTIGVKNGALPNVAGVVAKPATKPLAQAATAIPNRPPVRPTTPTGSTAIPTTTTTGSKPRTEPAGQPRTAPAGQPRTAPAGQPRTAPTGQPRTAPAGAHAATTAGADGNQSGTASKRPGQLPATPKNAPQQQGYASLQQAQASDAARARQVRLFVPPNSPQAAAGEPRVVPQKGDRPSTRKFVPPEPQQAPTDQKRNVEPLKVTGARKP